MNISLPHPTQQHKRSGLPLRRLLAELALLTLVAAVEKVVGLSAPMPAADAPSRLALAGYRISALPAARPRRGREMSLGTMRHFRLVPRSGEPALTLTLLPVRSRTGTDLSAETLGGKGLSLEAVGSDVPGFALKEQRIVSVPVAKGVGSLPRSDQLALGRGPKDPAGSTTRLQTCLTPSGLAAVTATTLAGEAKAPGKKGEPSPMLRRLLRVIGLQQARHECLAVQMESEASAGGRGGSGSVDRQRQLETVWRNLRVVLMRGEGA
ncbi:MAG: hypothetical protein ACK531_09925 [Cyanobacteriota bacterium]